MSLLPAPPRIWQVPDGPAEHSPSSHFGALCGGAVIMAALALAARAAGVGRGAAGAVGGSAAAGVARGRCPAASGGACGGRLPGGQLGHERSAAGRTVASGAPGVQPCPAPSASMPPGVGDRAQGGLNLGLDRCDGSVQERELARGAFASAWGGGCRASISASAMSVRPVVGRMPVRVRSASDISVVLACCRWGCGPARRAGDGPAFCWLAVARC